MPAYWWSPRRVAGPACRRGGPTSVGRWRSPPLSWWARAGRRRERGRRREAARPSAPSVALLRAEPVRRRRRSPRPLALVLSGLREPRGRSPPPDDHRGPRRAGADDLLGGLLGRVDPDRVESCRAVPQRVLPAVGRRRAAHRR